MRRGLRTGAFNSDEGLAEPMPAFVETYNQTAEPFHLSRYRAI